MRTKKTMMLVYTSPNGLKTCSARSFAKDGDALANYLASARSSLRALYGENSGHRIELELDTPENRAKYEQVLA